LRKIEAEISRENNHRGKKPDDPDGFVEAKKKAKQQRGQGRVQKTPASNAPILKT
jgi:hypothetical protein